VSSKGQKQAPKLSSPLTRLLGTVSVIGVVVLLAACSGKTTGTTNVTATSATLNSIGSCASGETCRWYWEYWATGSPRTTSTKAGIGGPVTGGTGLTNIPMSVGLTGLNPGTQYRWVFCGSADNGATYGCSGPNGTVSQTSADPPPDYATFSTPPRALGAYGAAVVANSPSVYYRLNEASGPEAGDSSGHSLNGHYQANVAYGVPGAIQTESTDSAVTASSGAVLTQSGPGLPTGNGARTYELWINSTTVPNTQSNPSPLLQNGDFTVSMAAIAGRSYDVIGIAQNGGGTIFFNAPYTLHDGVWHMVAVSWDGTNATTYIDGQTTGSATPTAYNTPPSAGITVGGYNGSFDEVAVYPAALSADRFDAHWTAGGSKAAACAATPNWGYAQMVLAANPRLYLGLRDLSQDSTERVAHDLSGRCANGAYQPGAAVDSSGGPPADTGGAVRLPGTVVKQTGQNLPTGNGARTYELWINSTTAPNPQSNPSPLVQNGDFTVSMAAIAGRSYDVIGIFQNGGGTIFFSAPYTLHDGVWHMVAVSYDGIIATAYVDGQTIGTATPTAYNTAPSAGITVGGYNGSFDEVAVYPAALSADRFNAHWTAGGSRAAACAATPNWGYAQTVLAANPRLYLGLRDLSQDSTERVAHDLSGRCANGAYQPGATVDSSGGPPADTGGAVRLPGTVVKQTGQNLPTGNGARTYELWINSTTAPDHQSNPSLLLQNGDFTVAMSAIAGRSYDVIGIFQNGGGTIYFNAPYTLHDGVWHMVAVSFDGTIATAYIDGQTIGTATPTAYNTAPSAGMTVGGYSASYDEVAVYDKALNPLILSAQYSGGSGQGPLGGGVTGGELYGNANPCFSCLAKQIRAVAGDPVDTATGNFSETYKDLAIPGRGLPLSFTRTYNSGAAATNGPLGFGWTMSYNASLTIGSGTVTVNQENAAQVNYTLANGVYSAPPRAIATLVKNGDGTYTFTRKHTQVLTFSPTGQLTSLADLNSNVTNLTYTGGRLTTVTDPAGRAVAIAYNASGLISGLSDPAGRSVGYAYNDGAGNLTDVTDVGIGNTHFTYDANHHLLTLRDARGNTTTNHYDAQNRVDWQTDRMTRPTTFSYSGTPLTAAGGSTTTTDAKGNQVLDQYQYGLRTATTKGYTTSSAATWRYTYDPATVAVTTQTDPNGNVWSYTDDLDGNLLTSTDPLQRQTKNTWDALGDKTSTTDAMGVTTSATYDATGNLLQTSTPLNGTTPLQYRVVAYGHGTHGDVTSMTDPDLRVWTYTYDSYGNKQTQTDLLGEQALSCYDNVGRITSFISPKGTAAGVNCATTAPAAYTTYMTYDAFASVLTSTDPLQHISRQIYDANQNLQQLTDANANVTLYHYDADNETDQVTAGFGTPQARTLTTDFNPDGTVFHQSDQVGSLVKTTTYLYDPLARVVSVSDPLLRVTTATYDGAGNKLTMKDPKNQTTAYGYDVANELKSVSYSDGVTQPVSYSYDGDGERLQMVDRTGTSTYSYDSLNRLTQSTSGAGAQLQYGHNLRGQVTSIVYPGTTGTVTRTYDNVARLKTVTDWLSHQTTFNYDANSNLQQTLYPNTVQDNRTFDNANRLMRITDTNSNGTILDLPYGRDNNNQLTAENAQTFGYSPLNQVTSAGSTTYAYDTADRLNQIVAPAGTSTLLYDAADQVQSLTQMNGVTQVAKYTYGYDPNGNRTSRTDASNAVTPYTYDQANRLVAAGSSASYVYNGDGTRVSKTVNAVTTQQTWDVSGGVALIIQDGTTNYVTGPGGLPLEQITGAGVVTYYCEDQLGSTRVLTNQSGTPVGTAAYDAYGNPVTPTGASSPFQYAGQYLDGESGLYYLRARFYDPSTGQFGSRDPLTSATRQSYAYVQGNPLNQTDQSGLFVTEGGSASDPIGYPGLNNENEVNIRHGPSEEDLRSGTGVAERVTPPPGSLGENPLSFVVQAPGRTVRAVLGVVAAACASIVVEGRQLIESYTPRASRPPAPHPRTRPAPSPGASQPFERGYTY
jgi:RHS repeat-associated protein